jgi:hypothetical protein
MRTLYADHDTKLPLTNILMESFRITFQLVINKHVTHFDLPHLE